jgi:outer membrane protein TolC
MLRTSVKLSQLELNLSDIKKKIEIAKQRINILMGHENDAEVADYKEPVESDTFTISVTALYRYGSQSITGL